MEVYTLKFRVLFLKKKQIYYFLLVVVVLLFFGVSVLSNNRASYTTFKVGPWDKTYKADLNGDGKEDLLYVTLNKSNKYYLQIISDKESQYLEPNKSLPTLGNYCLHWPMRVKLLDISRDKVPEIFLQSSVNNKPIQHIFIHTNNNYTDIFSSYNNTLGFIDCSNNQSPKIISGNIYQNNFSFANYILLQDKLEKYYYKTEETFMGKDTILNFINLITTLNPENFQPNEDIFDPKYYGNVSSVVKSLASFGSNFIFQDATFIDTKSNKDGKPIQVEWILNFRANSVSSPNELKNYTLKLVLNAFVNSKEKFYYKISFISLYK